ncbi:MAG: sirohydrochlorin chelatase [Burkholderiales bacterium]
MTTTSNPAAPQTIGIVLFAHGSRDPLWSAPMQAVAAQITQMQPALPVRCAYLELCEPDLPTATAQLLAAGCTTVRVLPLFLGVGKHARQDLPELIDQLRQQYPAVRFEVQASVGEDPRMIALMAQLALPPNLASTASQTAP